MNELDAALESFKPDLTARYERMIINQFERMVARFGPALKGVHNDWTFARTYSNLVAPVLVCQRDATPRQSVVAYFIDPLKLSALATMFANDAIDAWKGKIQEKMGTMWGVGVRRMDGVSFVVTGRKADGAQVTIHQQMITNVSPRGTVFNQFPARIYRDGKAISEAKFKAI